MLGLFCWWSAVGSVALAQPLKSDKAALLLLEPRHSEQGGNGWLMSEKLDGVRAYWDGKQLMSRNGKAFAAPDWFVRDFPPFELDGELWLGRNAFAETVSITNKKSPHTAWKNLHYQVFEVPNQPGGLLQRLAVLQRYLSASSSSVIQIIQQIPVKSKQQLHQYHAQVIALGGEGVVIRDPNESYHTGRSSTALKLKQKQDAECHVVGYIEGKGKYQGQVGSLKCQIHTGQFKHLNNQKSRVIRIGSGLTDKQRQNPPQVGSLITFQYMGLTKNGLPRFPVFLRERTDDFR